ncbi:phosphoenolpyruvate--protein phosphotransferase [Desulfobacter hydrogenophilus]|uniref:PTS system mannitol-specific EIICBA component n=1 Tax=Desulfobacter hydrogenophilus TaxID=2291 RepID=A0A328F7E0_9BACT|nr:phosphoenolpyruvate--protein phosphotransferase [Desulfobacter hydrogenophilus]NDY74307.1 phosphoenolpyruvate--protein phosphotransferase [Desulfobacter hydrogenophilus]QBH15183.1 phosphoenolpyruvate--protein phosphotransferase [Desulfobacter hydrogenophilus]RAM00126.1 phosphoenolpyruvate--protein phosphotransferase [Desulfobacter hydrogenophilus]
MSGNTLKVGVQSFGRFLSGMVMPNIGAFIAWGLITALFIPAGWLPNEKLASLVGPIITYLLPLLIGYTGGKMVGGDRGAVAGAVTTMGVIVGSDIPMFMGAMIAGPLGGLAVTRFDKKVHGKIKPGFEMLVNNFSLGIISMIVALIAYAIIGPLVSALTKALAAGVGWIVNMSLLPLVSIIVEPAKILFLNNAINHGVFTPLGAEQAAKFGASIYYMIETNPGPGLGILLAYMVAGKGTAQKSAYGAAIIHFFGGIHEIYFPYILMKPRLIIAVIAGGMVGVGFNMITSNALVGPPSPGSVFALTLMSTKGMGIVLTLSSIAVSTVTSFLIGSVIVRKDASESDDLEAATAAVAASKASAKGQAAPIAAGSVRSIIVACDAGMGSSAMGATVLRGKVKDAGLTIEVTNAAINDLKEADMVITQKELTDRARAKLPSAQHFSIDNFMDASFYDELVAKIVQAPVEQSDQAVAEEPLTVSPQQILVTPQQILLNAQVTTKDEVLELIAQHLSSLGLVSGDYLDALTAREEKVSTYLINGAAIPHGVNEAKEQVVQTGVFIVQVPQGVVWNDKGDVARLIVGIAAKGKDHLNLLQRLTNVVMDEAVAEKLATTTNKNDILDALNAKEQTAPLQQPDQQEDYSVVTEATVVDAQGMHARPAGLISEQAVKFSETDIRIRNNQRTATAKSMASLLSMGANQGDVLTISAQGPEAEQAVHVLAAMIGEGLDNEAEQANASYNPLTVLSALPDVQCRLTLKGSAASPGITMAPAFRLQGRTMRYEEEAQDPKAEAKLFSTALTEAALQLDKLKANLQSRAPNEAAILHAQKQLLQDELVLIDSEKFIVNGKTAAWSFNQAIEKQVGSLKTVDNERLRARIADLIDVRDRVVALMVPAVSAVEYPQTDFILLAKDLTPSQTAGLYGLKVRGICTELGGPNSHMAILARALGIPAVVGLGEGALANIEDGELIVVDPQASSIYLDPDEATQKNGKKWIEQWEQIRTAEDAQRHKAAETLDGRHIDVVCNIAKPEDAKLVLDDGGEGVGLLRTEFLFESSVTEPSIETQCNALKAIIKELGSRQLVVRTADIGGDKPVSWLHMPHEDNPFLGMRGIRLSFKYEDIFKRQLEAIYQTAIWQKETTGLTGLHIMFPMIGRMSEWRKARDIAEKIRLQLNAPQLPLGIMIEIPSAVMVAEHLAKEVDFFSIGSNDLTQYTLAIDRLHPDLCSDADSYHPALVKMVELTVKAAQAHGKWVGVCGNAASNPGLATLLVGLGVTELSVSPANVGAVKNIIRAVSYKKLQEKAHKALQLESSEAVMALYKTNDDLL